MSRIVAKESLIFKWHKPWLIVVIAAIGSYLALSSHAAGPFALPSSTNFDLFAANSPWKTRVDGPGVQLDPTSSVRVAGIKNMFDASIAGGGLGTGLNIATSVYIVDSRTTPLVPVYITNPTQSHHVLLDKFLSKGVPIPEGAQPAAPTDNHMVVYDSFKDVLYDFFQACPPTPSSQTVVRGVQRCPFASNPAVPAGQWQVNYGGIIEHASQNPGYYQDICQKNGAQVINLAGFPDTCDPGTQTQQWNWGSSASSLPISAGMITASELKGGQINHALSLILPAHPVIGHDTVCKNYVFPAQRTDGSSLRPDCVPEGAHLRIDPNFDLNTLHLPRAARVIADAAQKYGMIVNDRTNNSAAFYIEDPIDYKVSGATVNPYTGNPFGSNAPLSPNGAYGGVPAWAQFQGTRYAGQKYDAFPWDHVQLIKMSACNSSPCGDPNNQPPPANQPPVISLATPANGIQLPSPANINITTTATDPDGTVVKVEFFNRTTKLGEDLSAPYSFNWTNVPAGSYSLTAKATDNQGAVTTSAPVNITVINSQPPQCTLIGDLNCDGHVNFIDISVLISKFGTNDSKADLNHDGIVNFIDLSILLVHYGT